MAEYDLGKQLSVAKVLKSVNRVVNSSNIWFERVINWNSINKAKIWIETAFPPYF